MHFAARGPFRSNPRIGRAEHTGLHTRSLISMRTYFSTVANAMMAFCAALGLYGWRGGDKSSDAAAATVRLARVAVAQRGDISRVLTLAGQFQPYQVVDVHPKVSGYMRKINVDIGDIVKQGQTVA